MRKLKQCLLLMGSIILFMRLSSQTVHENTGWLAWFSSYKLSGPWALYFDGQARTADNWEFVRNVILRPGVTYVFNPKSSATVGYAYVLSYSRNIGAKSPLSEHRIWEQYIYNLPIGKTSLQNRFRLEQRFIERQTGEVFAQRLRYFMRSILPLEKQKNAFGKGFYVALQNEIFLNIQNKEQINNSVFDQNRIYGAIGYRFSPKVDIETGFMNQYVNGMTTDVSNNIIQLAVYTRL